MRGGHALGSHLLQVDQREQIRLLLADLVLDLAGRDLKQLTAHGRLCLLRWIIRALVTTGSSSIAIYPQFDLLFPSLHVCDLGH